MQSPKQKIGAVVCLEKEHLVDLKESVEEQKAPQVVNNGKHQSACVVREETYLSINHFLIL